MPLNRSLIKTQAKQLIKGKTWNLFLVIFVVGICISFISTACNFALNAYAVTHGITPFDYSNYSDFEDFFDDFDPEMSDDYGYGEDYGDTENGADFRNFTGKLSPVAATAVNSSDIETYQRLSSLLGRISRISAIFLAPLGVTLSIYFVWFIRGNEYTTEAGIKIIFRETFKNGYLKKLGVSFLRELLAGLLMMLFIVPGIVFCYSSYFAYELMCDYPELGAWEAIKLSKKMIRGHRGELFALDLSFIGWYFLCIFILPAIYALPYITTTKALYYENFRLRALQIGELSEDDFLSDAQRVAKYASGAGFGSNPFGEPPQPNSGYYPPVAQNMPPQGGYYQQPVYPPVQQMPPQGAYYQQPTPPPYAPPVQPPYAPTAPQQPTFTVSEPQEPRFAEVIVPQENFVEPSEPAEGVDPFAEGAEPAESIDPFEKPSEPPKPLSDDGKEIDL